MGGRKKPSAYCLAAFLAVYVSAAAQTSHQWVNQGEITVYFNITGSTVPNSAVHTVTLSIDTNGVTPTGSRLYGPGTRDSGYRTVPWSTVWDYGPTENDGEIISLTGSSGVYMLSIEEKPVGLGGGTIGVSEQWRLVLNVPTPNTVDIVLSALTRNNGNATSLVNLVPPPVPAIQPDPINVSAGTRVDFSVQPIYSSYLWTLTGGSDAAGTDSASASAVYRGLAGDYTATVRVTDDLGQEGTDDVVVHLTNNPPGAPVISAEPPSVKPFTGAVRRFTAAASDEIPSGTYAPTYAWTVTNGAPATAAGASVDVVFGTPGPASVSVVAKDSAGQESSETPLSLEVQPKETLVIPAFSALPGNNAPPAIDGRVTEGLPPGETPDVSWSGGTRVEYADGTTRDLAVQALSAPDASGNRFLYLSFEARNDSTFDREDVVVLAFRGPGSGTTPDTGRDALTGDVALLVYPLASASAGSNLAPYRVELWRFQGSPGAWARLWQTGDAGMGLSGLEARSRIHGAALANAWDLELKIPMRDLDAGDAVPWPDLKEGFLLYWNLCRVDSTLPADPTVAQFRWPREAPELSGLLSPGLLRPSDWCGATTDRNAVGRGVFIASPMDFGVMREGVLGNTIVIGASNRFEATIRNSSLRVAGEGASFEGAPAAGVRARFRIAGWGTAYNTATWQEIPPAGGSNNPTTAATISEPTNSAGHTDFDQPGSRTVGFESAPLGVPGGAAGNPHQCVYIELEALSNARIVNKKYYRNMNFVDASRFEDRARLDLVPGGPLPGSGAPDIFLLKVQRAVYDRDLRPVRPLPSPGPAVAPGPDKISTLVWTAHSFRDTGSKLVIRGKAFKVVEPSGSFGYFVRHKGEVSKWKYELTGIDKVGKDLYRYELPPAALRSAEGLFLDAAIRPVEPRWLAGPKAGTALPVGATASDYGPGLAAGLDLGARAAGDFWILGSLGYAGLEGKGANSDAQWLDASLAAAYAYGFRRNFLIRARIGAGWYQEAAAASGAYGAEIGLGAEYRLRRGLDAEIGAVYRRVFDAADTQFVAATAGLIWRF